MILEPYQRRQAQLLQELTSANPEHFYEKLIGKGRGIINYDLSIQIEQNRIKGCQSSMYLSTNLREDGTLHFEAYSDALISAGLAYIVITLFNGLTPSEIIQADLSFIKELGIESSISPSRINGLGSLIQRIKQDAYILGLKSNKVT
jgi:cysteine desulfuration protein SufE